jgi:hypothetical protein
MIAMTLFDHGRKSQPLNFLLKRKPLRVVVIIKSLTLIGVLEIKRVVINIIYNVSQ